MYLRAESSEDIATNQGESDKRRRQICIGPDQIMERIKDRIRSRIEKKREVRIISPVSYYHYFYNIMTRTTFPLFNVI